MWGSIKWLEISAVEPTEGREEWMGQAKIEKNEDPQFLKFSYKHELGNKNSSGNIKQDKYNGYRR